MVAQRAFPRVGLVVVPVSSDETIELIIRADRAGVGAVWLEMNAFGLDPLPLLAVAAARTERIALGTAIVPAFGRHPAALAAQALAVEGIAPGRLRLGIGTGNAARMATVFGHPPDRPLSRLSEFIQILRLILQRGEVRFRGDFYAAEVHDVTPTGTPVLLSALGPKAFRAAGELSDGVLSWLCPTDYLLKVAKTELASGAANVGRTSPPLIAHVPVALGRESHALREAVREDLAAYSRVPVFRRMFAGAGHLTEDGVPDSLLDSMVVWGNEEAVAARLSGILESGVDEVMVSRTPETPDRRQEDALLRVLASVSAA